MGDLLGSLVQDSQKRTILCVIWGGMLQVVEIKGELMSKPVRVYSKSLGILQAEQSDLRVCYRVFKISPF
jgi:hypothetical protein